MSRTDFNDLHREAGLKAVADQVMGAIEQARFQSSKPPVPEPDDAFNPDQYAGYVDGYAEEQQPNSPHPSDTGGAANQHSLERLLQRYAYATPSGKIWDLQKTRFLKKGPFRDLVTPELFNQWMKHESRRTVEEDDVKREQIAAQKAGGVGVWGALERYVYLYPETSAWDTVKRKVVSLTGLKAAIADCYEDWLKHPERREIDIENLVFDPTQTCDPETHINMFRGLAMEPAESDKGCRAIFDLVSFLCNGDKEVYTWLLKWLAYPLQNVGAKMASAVMMHSVIQGSGKSLFFDGVMRKIYGEYSATLGQHQLESQYTDWRSQMLYAVFEEIFSRDQKYSHTGTMKQMITGETMRIEKKFVAGWEEANHMNGVFLSNEIQPFPVEPHDRRMLVIWPEGKLDPALQARVVAEIEGGGVAAFYRYLLNIDLSGFHPHTQPPMTEAKERLIDFGRPGWDLFYREWERDALGAPFQTCLLSDLYVLYQRWCRDSNEKPLSKNKLSQFVSSMEGVRRRKDAHYRAGVNSRKGTFIQVGDVPEDMSQQEWFGRSAEGFRSAIDKLGAE